MFARAHLIAALRLRYDHHSAQAVFEAALARCGLADQPAYSLAELASFRMALAKIGDRLDRVNAHIDEYLGGSVAPEASAPQTTAHVAPPVAAEIAPPAAAPVALPQPPPVATPAPTAAAAPAAATAPVVAVAPATAVSETTVVLTGVDAVADDVVLLCGGSPALGDWDPTNGCAMTRDADRWTAKLQLPSDAAIEFKFVRRAPDGTFTWERGDNRTLVAKPMFETTWR
ncbi:MAG: carbohydrate-binding module family 20 domain-containing protein [Kofleriaceae bacterium]|nr:carbohydrate-binding module family 20 domain-containing protein [Kofleriaceae bacterium]